MSISTSFPAPNIGPLKSPIPNQNVVQETVQTALQDKVDAVLKKKRISLSSHSDHI